MQEKTKESDLKIAKNKRTISYPFGKSFVLFSLLRFSFLEQCCRFMIVKMSNRKI